MQSRNVVHLKVGKERRGECVGLLLTAAGRRCDPKALFVLLWCAGVSCDGAFCLPPRQRLSPAMTSRLSVVARWGWLVLEFGIGSSAPHVWRRPGSKKVEDFSRTWSSRACSGPQLQRAAHHDKQQLQSCNETSNATATSMHAHACCYTGQTTWPGVRTCGSCVSWRRRGYVYHHSGGRSVGTSRRLCWCCCCCRCGWLVGWLAGWMVGWFVCVLWFVCVCSFERTLAWLFVCCCCCFHCALWRLCCLLALCEQDVVAQTYSSSLRSWFCRPPS